MEELSRNIKQVLRNLLSNDFTLTHLSMNRFNLLIVLIC